MGEVAGNSGPTINLQQQVGDLDVRQHAVERVPESLRLFGHTVLKRTDLESGAPQFHIGQFALDGQRIGVIERFAKARHAFFKIVRRRCRHGDVQA